MASSAGLNGHWAAIRLLAWVPPLLVLTQHGATIKLVTGRSMQPTLNPHSSPTNDVVLLDRFSVARRRFARGDVIVLKSPSDHKLLITKRIMALEGDIVPTLPPYPDPWILVPKGHVWVEGDEPFHSRDSNTFGPIALGLVDSKVGFVLWPPSRWGPLPAPTKRSSGLPSSMNARLNDGHGTPPRLHT